VGLFAVSVAGALGNLALAAVCMAVTVLMVIVVAVFSSKGVFQVVRMVTLDPPAEPGIVAWTAAFTTYTIYVNLALAFFNLLPLPGLDGFNVLVSLFGFVRGATERLPMAEGQSGVKRPVAPTSLQPAAIHYERGAEYHAGGNFEGAIARYRQAIASDDHYGPAYVNLGLAYLAAGQRERAIHALRGATQYASDEESRRQAWSQLHKLSQFNPAVTPVVAGPGAAEAGPWTDVRPSFRWSGLWLNAGILLVVMMCVYTYLTVALIGYFS
jgi:tetratricopeptide (TPR) repeat protein